MENQEKSTNGENSERYLQFDLGEESYAIRLLEVREVIPQPATTKLPNGPSHFVGIMNLRGQIISIIDLRKKLGVNPKKEDREEAVVIVNLQGTSIGLVVDTINKVLNFDAHDVSEVPEIQTQVNAKYISGVYRNEDKLTVLLDLEKILNIDEIKRMSKKAA